MVVSNVWGRGGESTKRTLFDPMRSSAQTIWKFQHEVSFFSLAKCFIGEKYELSDRRVSNILATVMSLLRLLRDGLTRGMAPPSCSVAVISAGELPLRTSRLSSRPTSRGGSVIVYLADAQVPSVLCSDRRDKASIFRRRSLLHSAVYYFFSSSANCRLHH